MERIILHSDLNAFYASVEVMLSPDLQGKAVAVCGSTEDRHGIVLAKSEKAKKAGIKTGMVTWEAQRLCKDLIVVPPHYDQYLKYSKLTRAIYQRYTDQVEPYGMDECWLDVTGSTNLFGSGPEIADSIRQTVKSELGLTVSIGVSFNKIFAKLGSDLKKPDATTIIARESYKDQVWPLPVSDLFYCGPATTNKMISHGIHTIGDLAQRDPAYLRYWLNADGLKLWDYANGNDQSPVANRGYASPIKSIGHGNTYREDLETPFEVWKVILEQSQDIGHKLRLHGLAACGVQITVKDNQLDYRQYQAPVPLSTQSPMEIAQQARAIFNDRYQWHHPVRALTVRAINLVPADLPVQTDLFFNAARQEKQAKIDSAVEDIRRRFGKRSVISAVLMGDNKIPAKSAGEIILPGMMGR